MIQNQADPERATSALRAVLLEREFAPDPIREYWKRLWAWFTEIFGFKGDLLSGLSPVMRWVVIIALVVVLVLLLAHLAWTFYSAARAIASRPRSDVVVGKTREKTLEEALDLARAALDRKDWLGAMRSYFVASVAVLTRQGHLDIRAGFTHREILARGGADPVDRQALSPLITRLDNTWFGGANATEDDAIAFKSAFENWAQRGRAKRRL